MEKVKIGLVGCGLFGESHLQAFRAVRGAKISAVYDIDRERAERISREFDISKICNSLEEICGSPELDAIDVVTPEHLHFASVMCALGNGKHVFVEKPFALDLRRCEDMIAAAASANRFIMVGQVLRFETKYAMLKDEIASGRLGKVVSMHARRNRPKSLLPRYGRTHPALENCIHDIDLMLWYTQSRVTRVRGYGRSATGSVHHDTFWGILEFESGAVGVVETIWLIPPSAGVMLDDALEVIGDAGVANVRLIPASLELWLEAGPQTPDVGYDPRVAASARGALREELAYFCDCVLDNRLPSIIKAEEAMAAVEVALALVESARLDKEIEIAPCTGRNV
jgi:UDP-N-acetylglucosamine 3-dehydrogenase